MDVDNQLMHLIKLTTARSKSTYGDVSWVPGTTVSIPESERGDTLAYPGLLHVYHGDTIAEALALGLMMDPGHAQIGPNARAYEVHGDLVVRRAVLGGAHALDVGDEIQVVLPTAEQRVRYGIYCAQAVIGGQCQEWSLWAARWLSGEDRSAEAADAAARAAARAAAWAAAWAARAAAEAVWAAAEAAAEAAMAAEAAGDLGINLGKLALRAIEEEQ